MSMETPFSLPLLAGYPLQLFFDLGDPLTDNTEIMSDFMLVKGDC